MRLPFLLIFYFIISFSEGLHAADILQQPSVASSSDSFYTWLAKSHVMYPSSLTNVNLALINNNFVSIDRIINSTPLIKFYADCLQREGVPLDFAILPLIESGNNPQARSPMNALGLWQFIPSTGYEWGLGKTQLHDERTDVKKSTLAAAKYLKSLYMRYQDWNLVLAAYNWGPGSVDRALRKGLRHPNGQIDLQLLPQETRNYLIYFYSFNLKIRSSHENKLMSRYPNKPYLVEIKSKDLKGYFNSSNQLRGVSWSVFRHINGFSPDLIDKVKGEVLLPTDVFSKYFSVEKISFNNKKNYRETSNFGKCSVGYQARYGDTLQSIAAKNNLKVDTLSDLNPSVRFVRPGMKINLCELK